MSGSIAVSSGGDVLPKTVAYGEKPVPRHANAEPLARFAEAKKSIAEIFGDLTQFVDDLNTCYANEPLVSESSLKDDVRTKLVAQKEEAARLRDSVKAIRETFQRNHMKVVFFGRTSNGKSTTVNAMLGAKILPQGLGHTTCCFLQVEGVPEGRGYLQVADNEEHFSLDRLNDMGNALSDENKTLPAMGQDEVLHVCCPRSVSRLLTHDVVILDSPGIDLSPEFDSWIDKHCLDADVFVLVCNAEATLTQSEKNFFHRVADRLSKPNVFVLNNRWDASAAEGERVNQVRDQHMARFRHFLVDELGVCGPADFEKRVFFVSSREMLESRLAAQNKLSNPFRVDGHQLRAHDFEQFEKQFEKCISRSAIRSKFEAHARRAREIVAQIQTNSESLTQAIQQARDDDVANLEKQKVIFNECRANFSDFQGSNYRQVAEALRAEVHLKVSAVFKDEIARLATSADLFEDAVFENTPESIEKYKASFLAFLEQRLSAGLVARCTAGLSSRIWNIENDLFKHVYRSMMAERQRDKLEELWRFRQPFYFSIEIKCAELAADFREDLSFRFSFSPYELARRAYAYFSGRPLNAAQAPVFQLMAALQGGAPAEPKPRPQGGEAAVGGQEVANNDNKLATMQLAFRAAEYAASGSVGAMILAGIFHKSLNWRLALFVASTYGGLYALEYVRWNGSKKEQVLKDQLRAFLATRISQVAVAHTAHCEAQALREVDSVWDALKKLVNEVHREIKGELERASKAAEEAEKRIRLLGALRNKTSFLLSSLDGFASVFLTPDSPLVG